jgi:predicted secreted protein
MGQAAFGTLLKRGDNARKTLTLTSVAAEDTITINDLVFTAHATVTTEANREFSISGDDTADAAELVTCINDATYGVAGVTATSALGVVTLSAPPDVTITATSGQASIVVAAATETFTAVGEITSIGGPNFSMETIDVTHHTSANGYREWVASFKDSGEVPLEMNFVPSDAGQNPTTGLLLDFENRAQRNYQIVWPTTPNKTGSFAAYMTGFSTSAPVDGKLSASATLKITGAVTWS